MYNSPKASIFTHGMYTEPFETQIGVKQGDVLRTLLFNIFVNDLPHEISKQSMIFNKPGATIKKYIKKKEIESVKQYTYLSFTFVPSGKMNEGIENLLNKGKKAWFAIQKSLQKFKAKTVKTYLKLIDTLIKPIILYACEAWGDIRTKKLFENKIEKFQLYMCKQTSATR